MTDKTAPLTDTSEGMRYLERVPRKIVTVYLPLGIIILVLLFPFYWMALTAVKPNEQLLDMERVSPFWTWTPTFQHIHKLLFDSSYPQWLWNTMYVAAAATVLSIMMFVLVSAMAVRGQWSWGITGTVLALIAVRAGAKVSSLLATGFGTGMALRQTLWVSATLVPMSAVALLLTSQFVKASHSVGTQVAAIALPVILVTELLGAMMVSVALVRAGEAPAPWRGRKTDTANASDTEARP